jgi:hypothetical protein
MREEGHDEKERARMTVEKDKVVGCGGCKRKRMHERMDLLSRLSSRYSEEKLKRNNRQHAIALFLFTIPATS